MTPTRETFFIATWGLTPHFAWPHSCIPVKPQATRVHSQQDPTTQPTSTVQRPPLKGGNSLDQPVSVCQERGHFFLALHFSFGPRDWSELLGRQESAHLAPLVLLVRLSQVSRPAQSWPRRRSCPSSFELCLRHVIWVEGGRLTSFKSSLKEESVFTFG